STATENKLRAKELRAHSDEELHKLTGSLSEELFKYRMQRYTNQLENTMVIRKLRRDLARVKTILSGRASGLETQRDQAEIEAAPPPEPKSAAAKRAALKERARAVTESGRAAGGAPKRSKAGSRAKPKKAHKPAPKKAKKAHAEAHE